MYSKKNNMHTSAEACRTEIFLQQARMYVYVYICRSNKHTSSFEEHRYKHQQRSGGLCLRRSKPADLRHQNAADSEATWRSKKGAGDQVQGRPTTTNADGWEDDWAELLLPARLRSFDDSSEKAVRGADAAAAGREQRVETT
jgi:hypothetical protein